MRYAMLSRTSEATSAPKAVASSEATSKSLRIGEANDSFEQEADRVADEVMAGGAQLGWSFSKIGIGAPIQVKCSCGGSSTPEGECEECKETGMLQREASGPTRPGVAPPIVHEVLRAPGQPLDAQVVSFFEPRFSLDFSKVRVHTDHQAAQAAKAVGALAYTVGNHIVFGDGDRSQSTTSGRRLLAHELAHVVQQENHSLLQRKEDPVRRFVEGQLVVAQTPFPLMDKLGGARGQQKVKQIAKGDLLRVEGDAPGSGGLAYQVTVMTNRTQAELDDNGAIKTGVASSGWLAGMPAETSASAQKTKEIAAPSSAASQESKLPAKLEGATKASGQDVKPASGPPTPALSPITPQPPAPPPPGVTTAQYEASTAKGAARQKEVGDAHRAGMDSGRQFGEALGRASESLKMIQDLAKLPKPRFARLRDELEAGLAAKLNAIPLPPTYDDPELQKAAISGFEVGTGTSYADAQKEAQAVSLASTAALSLQGDIATAGESVLGKALARLARFPVPVIGLGAGGIGIAWIPRRAGTILATEGEGVFVQGARPPGKFTGMAPKESIYYGVPKALQGPTADAIETLQKAMQYDQQALNDLTTIYNRKPMTGEMRGWDELSPYGRHSPLRLLFRFDKTGGRTALKLMFYDPHVR